MTGGSKIGSGARQSASRDAHRGTRNEHAHEIRLRCRSRLALRSSAINQQSQTISVSSHSSLSQETGSGQSGASGEKEARVEGVLAYANECVGGEGSSSLGSTRARSRGAPRGNNPNAINPKGAFRKGMANADQHSLCPRRYTHGARLCVCAHRMRKEKNPLSLDVRSPRPARHVTEPVE